MKPSERIIEIRDGIIKDNPWLYNKSGREMSGPEALDLRVECMERYLDEEGEKVHGLKR